MHSNLEVIPIESRFLSSVKNSAGALHNMSSFSPTPLEIRHQATCSTARTLLKTRIRRSIPHKREGEGEGEGTRMRGGGGSEAVFQLRAGDYVKHGVSTQPLEIRVYHQEVELWHVTGVTGAPLLLPSLLIVLFMFFMRIESFCFKQMRVRTFYSNLLLKCSIQSWPPQYMYILPHKPNIYKEPASQEIRDTKRAFLRSRTIR